MNADYFRDLYAYNYTLHRKVWDSIMALTEAQFLLEIPYSIGSLRNHMVHLASVDQRWMAALQEVQRPDRLNPADFETREQVRAKYDDVERRVLEYVNSLTDDDVTRVQTFATTRPDGSQPSWTGPRAMVLAHVVNHGTDHRAQILRVLADLGAPTFPQDYIIYRWDKNA